MAEVRRLGFVGDDLSVLLPNRLEQLGQELATLDRLGLGGPEAREVIEDLPGAGSPLCLLSYGKLLFLEYGK